MSQCEAHRKEIQVNMLKYAIVHQRLQIREQISVFVLPASNTSTEWSCMVKSSVRLLHLLGVCVKSVHTYLHVLSSWRNQVPGSLPFLSMYASKVLQCSGSTVMYVQLGEQDL